MKGSTQVSQQVLLCSHILSRCSSEQKGQRGSLVPPALAIHVGDTALLGQLGITDLLM